MLTIHTRRSPALAAVAVLAVTAAGVAHGAGGGGNGIVNFGPYHLTNGQDISTCGAPWANGVGRHVYHVYAQPSNGTYLITAEGHVRLRSFDAVAVGACDNGQPNDGSRIGPGVRVKIALTAVFKVTGGTLNPDATCAAPCDPQHLVNAAFGPSATVQLLSWTGTYTTDCNGSYFYILTPDGVEHDAGNITGDAHAC